MGLGRAYLGDWTIRSRGGLHASCRAGVIRSRRYRVGDGCHPASDRRIGRETWRAESGGGHRYGDGCAPYPARNHRTSVYALCLLDRSHGRTRAADKGEVATSKSALGGLSYTSSVPAFERTRAAYW